MEALIDHGETWLEPLFEFREWLATTIDPSKKHEYRDAKGRDGRVVLKKDGTPTARTYKLDTSRDMLRRIFSAQKALRAGGHADVLITDAEIHEIRRLWRTERQDWDDSVPAIYKDVFGFSLDWRRDDDTHFDSDQKTLLANICSEYDVPFPLVAKLLEAERRSHGIARRAGVQKRIGVALREEWRDVEDIVAEHRDRMQLV
jgi:DNA sulfur modification protein DndC